MNETIQRSIDRNFERILHNGRGAVYVGHEDWLREGLALMAKTSLARVPPRPTRPRSSTRWTRPPRAS